MAQARAHHMSARREPNMDVVVLGRGGRWLHQYMNEHDLGAYVQHTNTFGRVRFPLAFLLRAPSSNDGAFCRAAM